MKLFCKFFAVGFFVAALFYIEFAISDDILDSQHTYADVMPSSRLD